MGRYVAALTAEQTRRGWSVAVASPAAPFLADEARAAGACHLDWGAGRQPGPADLVEARRLARLVGSVRPDLVHLHSSKAGLAGRLTLRGRVPTVFQPHAWSFLAVTGAARRTATGWERLAARWTDAFVCVSAGERSLGEAAGIRGTWHVIANGVELGPAAPSQDDREEARRRLGEPPTPTVVCVGRICAQKGQDLLLEAWPAVVERVPAARLVLVGGGPDFERLSRRAGAGVAFVGHRDDVADWLTAADVVAIPSRWEGMSTTMLDAMARGRSVVSADVAGAVEALGTSAESIVPAGDPQALAAALSARLADPDLAAAEGRANRAAAEASFGFDRVGREVADLYAELVGRA